MRRIISIFAVIALLVSLCPAVFADGDSYIPAPYNAAEVDPTVTYLEPVFYVNENGPTIGVTTVGVIESEGLYFKDMNNNQELDPFEDWRLDAKERAADMVSKMTLEDQAGFVFNALAITPGVPKLDLARNEDGTINPAAIVTILAEGEESKNAYANSFAGLDSFVINTQKVRAGVYRGGLNFDASTVALYNNVVTEMSEADAALRGVPNPQAVREGRAVVAASEQGTVGSGCQCSLQLFFCILEVVAWLIVLVFYLRQTDE